MLTELSSCNFSRFRKILLSYSKRFTISLEDAEELVNDSILKALDYFDNDRGSFEGLCKIILKRKVLNFKRDNANLFLLILIDESEEVITADVNTMEEKEKNEMAIKFIYELKNKLEDDELRMFEALYKMSNQKISIAKAAKSIGLEPLKGWDIFRKIQRKASVFYDDSSMFEAKGVREVPDFFYSRGKVPALIISNSDHSEKGKFEIFIQLLDENSISKLNKIYTFQS